MEVPYQKLNPQTLRNLVLEFVSREGTDYGHRDWDMERKVEQVLAQLERGEATILFDPDEETCNIVTRETADAILKALDEESEGLEEDS